MHVMLLSVLTTCIVDKYHVLLSDTSMAKLPVMRI